MEAREAYRILTRPDYRMFALQSIVNNNNYINELLKNNILTKEERKFLIYNNKSKDIFMPYWEDLSSEEKNLIINSNNLSVSTICKLVYYNELPLKEQAKLFGMKVYNNIDTCFFVYKHECFYKLDKIIKEKIIGILISNKEYCVKYLKVSYDRLSEEEIQNCLSIILKYGNSSLECFYTCYSILNKQHREMLFNKIITLRSYLYQLLTSYKYTLTSNDKYFIINKIIEIKNIDYALIAWDNLELTPQMREKLEPLVLMTKISNNKY